MWNSLCQYVSVDVCQGLIGYVGQEPALSPTSILENIRLGDPTASDDDVKVANKLPKILIRNAVAFTKIFPLTYFV